MLFKRKYYSFKKGVVILMKRIQKTSTGLYFDSFKHLKNNLSNLISIELNKLCNSTDLKYYMDLKPVNRKSKLPDMKKNRVN
mgnify:FL=1